MKTEYLAIFSVTMSLLTCLVSCFGAYLGVRIALAEIRTQQQTHNKEIERLDDRVTFLERKHT